MKFECGGKCENGHHGEVELGRVVGASGVFTRSFFACQAMRDTLMEALSRRGARWEPAPAIEVLEYVARIHKGREEGVPMDP